MQILNFEKYYVWQLGDKLFTIKLIQNLICNLETQITNKCISYEKNYVLSYTQ